MVWEAGMEDVTLAMVSRASCFCWQGGGPSYKWVCREQILEESAKEEDHGQLPLGEH